MVDRRIVSSDDVARIGLRIKAARTLTSLNQEEFAERHGFGYASVKNWELGKSIPRGDTVVKIVTAFRDGGVQTTRDWLLYGSGSGPTHIYSHEQHTDSVDARFEREIQSFERWCCNAKKHPIVSSVIDDLMNPLFDKGDIIGAEGITSIADFQKRYPAKPVTKQPFLVELEPGHFQPRFLGKDSDGVIKYSCSINGHQINELKYTGLGKIIWIQKTY